MKLLIKKKNKKKNTTTAPSFPIPTIYLRDRKVQEEIREIWVTMEKEDRRVIEDLQAYKVFLDHQ